MIKWAMMMMMMIMKGGQPQGFESHPTVRVDKQYYSRLNKLTRDTSDQTQRLCRPLLSQRSLSSSPSRRLRIRLGQGNESQYTLRGEG